MEESNTLRQLFTFLQGAVYASVLLEFAMYLPVTKLPTAIQIILEHLGSIPIYHSLPLSKAFTIFLILIVSVGSRPRKNIHLNPMRQIIIPLLTGMALIILSMYSNQLNSEPILYGLSVFQLIYMGCSFIGVVAIHISLDNVSKQVKSGLMKDRFNLENESFQQEHKKVNTPYSINMPMQYYYQHRMHKGWLNIINPFRGILLIGTPGSGKTYSIIIPAIRQHIAKGFSMVVYDFKYPDLTDIAYYQFLKEKKKGNLRSHRFHLINPDQLEKSRRVNPLKAEYIPTMATATETAESLVEALRKSDESRGSDQFFSQSAINFLAAIIYFFSRYDKGKYSTLAHVMAFTNHSYQEIFETLYQVPELRSLLTPFRSAYEKKAFDQLEGQVGTLRINLSRLATKESFWIFSGDDVPLNINDKTNPSILILANDPETQSINSACYAVILNRLIRQINQKSRIPCSVILDEVPTIYIHKIENLLATARSNKVSILLGLQELPQLRQQYGKETTETICSVTANVLSGAARHKDTLMWLEKLFGKVRQIRNGLSVDRHRTSVSMNEYMDFLIPASRIANLQTGDLVGHVAGEKEHCTNTYHCKIMINQNVIKREEKRYRAIPDTYDFGETKEEILNANMERIVKEVSEVVEGRRRY